MGIFFVSTNVIANNFNLGSVKPLAVKLRPMLKPGDKIVSYNTYYQDLPFYTRHPVIVVGWADELWFSLLHKNTGNFIWSEQKLWREWQSSAGIYLMTKKKDYKQLEIQFPKKHFYLIGKIGKTVLLTNQEYQR